MVFDTRTSVQRLRAVGVSPSLAHDLLSLVQKWSDSCGEEWTVDRVKAIKVDLVRHFAGLSPTKSHSWIYYSRSGVPKGPFGALFKLSKDNFKVAWNAVMVYTALSFNHPELRVTERQWKKALAAIRRPSLDAGPMVDGLRVVHQSPLNVTVTIHSSTGSPLVDYQPSSTRRAPKDIRFGRSAPSTVPEASGVIDSTDTLIRSAVWSVQNWDILSGTMKGLEDLVVPYLELIMEDERKSGGPLPHELPEMGILALIQEAGYKLRFAANPFRVYQSALQPLGKALFDALRQVPNDFTFDQLGGVAYLQHLLQCGYPAASMDLSNATDNSPLEFQLEFLSKLGVGTRWLQFFRDTCKGSWKVRPSLKGGWQTLNWTVGSPLGLYPTFASFALWHHAVVQYCFQELGVPKFEGQWPYAIVGDDVTICDWDVARLYRNLMESWGVPISESKTLWSATTAEFLGRVVTARAVYQGFKWKGRVSDESFIDLCRNYGPRALVLLRPRQRAVVDFIADLPEPYGLGWNPLGIPLDERFPEWLERVMTREERVRTFSRRATRVNRLLYESTLGRHVRSFSPVTDEWRAFLMSDQDMDRLTEMVLPGFSSMGEAIWANVFDVASSSEKLRRSLSAELRLSLTRTSYVETRKEASALILLERKVRRAIARGR